MSRGGCKVSRNLKLKDMISHHIQKNTKTYFFLFMAFVIGISAGAFSVNGLSVLQKDDLSKCIQDYFLEVVCKNTDKFDVFKSALIANLKLVIVLWLLGMTIIGMPIIFFLICLRGFITGFSSGFMIYLLGAKGAIFSFLVLLPKELIIIPCLICLGVHGVNFSYNILKNNFSKSLIREDFAKIFISYCSVIFFTSTVVIFGVFFESYISSLFLYVLK